MRLATDGCPSNGPAFTSVADAILALGLAAKNGSAACAERTAARLTCRWLLMDVNPSGGVLGEMISPQNLTIAATAVGLVGRESDIFRRVVLWSLGLLVALCLLVGLQSTVLAWMLP